MKRLLTAVVLLLGAAVSMTVAQPSPQPSSPTPDRSLILDSVRAVMKQAHFATLVTVAEDGQPQARVVDPSDPDPDLTVWIGTNPASRKVAQLRKNSRVTLLYFDQATYSYVSLLGSASLVSDQLEKERRWKPAWAPFYPDGPRSKNFILIRFTPRTLEILGGPSHFQGDPKTWRPVVLELR